MIYISSTNYLAVVPLTISVKAATPQVWNKTNVLVLAFSISKLVKTTNDKAIPKAPLNPPQTLRTNSAKLNPSPVQINNGHKAPMVTNLINTINMKRTIT